jgi:hypothetical protein
MAKIGSADFARMYGDPDEDYDTFEKCVVRSIDSLGSLADFLDSFLTDIELGQMEGSKEFVKELRTQKAVCLSLRDSLKGWSLMVDLK